VEYFAIALLKFFISQSAGEKKLKIGQYLAKLEAKIKLHPFSGHGVVDT